MRRKCWCYWECVHRCCWPDGWPRESCAISDLRDDPGWHPFNCVQWVQDQLDATRRIQPWLYTKMKTAAVSWLREIIASWRQNWFHHLSAGRARYSSEMDINICFCCFERRFQIQIKYRFWKTGDAFDDVFITNRGSLLVHSSNLVAKGLHCFDRNWVVISVQ